MFKGSIVALVTPFESSGEIDFRALQKLLTLHLDAGTDGFVIAGSTGESINLHAGEVAALLDAAVGHVAGQVPVLAGTGNASTERAIAATQLAESLGASGALVVTPCYNRPPQRGLLAHFRSVADSSGLPIVLYNVPSRTGVDLLPETVRELAGHSNIVAIKEAVGSVERNQQLLEFCNDDFCLLSGDDPTCLRVMEMGAKGVISVSANIAPRQFKQLCQAVEKGDFVLARQIDRELEELNAVTALESNPIPVKWALHEMGLCGPGLRLPLVELSPQHHATVRRCLSKLGVLGDQ